MSSKVKVVKREERPVPAALLGTEWQTTTFQESLLDMTVRDEVAFQEFFFPDPSAPSRKRIPVSKYVQYHKDNHLKLYPSQLPLVLWNVAVHCCGRGVGKTLIGHSRYHIQKAISFPGIKIGDFAQSATHVDKLFRDTIPELKEHPLLKCFLKNVVTNDNGSIINFRNGSHIFFRFPGRQARGQERAVGLQSERADGSSGDEAQNLTATAYQTASNWHLDSPNDVNMQRTNGLFKRLTGVPDGKRETPLYDADVGKTNLEFVRRPQEFPGLPFQIHLHWHLPSVGVGYHNRKVHRDWLTRSGSILETAEFSQNYLQDTWGLHGRPSHGIFPLDLRMSVSRQNDDWKSVVVLPQEFIESTAAINGFDANGKLITPNFSIFDSMLPDRLEGPYAFGMDVGKSADTCICAWRRVKESWRWEFLLTLRGWREMEHQCFVVDYLTDRYAPVFWGIDQSTLGMSIVSPLQSNPIHDHDYRSLIRGFDSTGSYQFEQAEEIVAEWASKQERTLTEAERTMQLISAQKIAKKQPYAAWTIQRIAQLMQRREILLPTPQQAIEIHRELDSISVTRIQTITGGIRLEIKPAHPHIVDSVKTFVAGLKLWEAEVVAPRPEKRISTATPKIMAELMMGGMGL